MMKNSLHLCTIVISLTIILIFIPVQEAYATVPTMAGTSTTVTTTTITLDFNVIIYNPGGDGDISECLAVTSPAATIQSVTTVPTTQTGAGPISVTITLTAGTALNAGDTPIVTYSATACGGTINHDNGAPVGGDLMVDGTNVTVVDGIAPTITVSSPSNDEAINDVTTTSSDISFSFDEAVASNANTKIDFIGTAGGDNEITRTCTLVGAALNTGAHNNFELDDTTDSCDIAVSLVDGSTYTIRFNAVDSDNNAATQVELTGVIFDTTAPTFTARTTSTTTTTTVTFDEAINGGNFVAGDWNVAGVAATVIAPSGAAGGETSIVLSHATIGVDDTPSVQYTAGNLADSAGNLVVGNTVTAADGNPAIVSGGGSGSGSHTAPSFTTGFSEDELPFLLNGNEIDVSNFVNEVGVTTIKTSEATNLSLLLSDDDGVIYVGLYTNLRDSERQRHQSDTIIEWRNNDGLSVIDPHGYFEDASVIVSDKGNKKEFSFDITFANTMEKSDLIVYVWDIRRNAFQTSILDMWEVIDSPKSSHVTEPEITTDVSEPSKDTSESIPPTNISVVMDNWAGYSESTSSDSEMLQSIGLEGEYIPNWVKKLGGWVHKGLIDDADFINAIKNLHSRGLVY